MTTTRAGMRPSQPNAVLEPRFVGDIDGSFFVPSYQRGYRWTPVEVKQLLDDIWSNRDQAYYLQPIVVRERDEEWELIDGQQRLTTLFLIMQYMADQGLQSSGAGYRLRYQTRPSSAEFLSSIDSGCAERNVDFFHMYRAYKTIDTWFADHGNRRQYAANQFYSALFESARIIWYEVEDDVDSTTLFRRLNVGRIPLTDAELIKALLLSRVRSMPEIAPRAYEIAAQWDQIERQLREPELWAFISGSDHQPRTNISLLLDALAGGPTGLERPLFHTFTTLQEDFRNDPLEAWHQVTSLHALIVGWYQDHELFHRIGYLVAENQATVPSLLDDARGLRRSEFSAYLDSKITEHLKLTESDLRDLTYTSKKTNSVLLLMNVETIRQQPHSGTRYSFHHHALGDWSLEHIHAQNAEALNRQEQWRSWLAMHAKMLDSLPEQDLQADRSDLLTRTKEILEQDSVTENQFRALEQEYTATLSSSGQEDDIHSINNLALLNSGNNTALSNAVFAVKRATLIELDQTGSYIPICTRNAFLKYYSPPKEMQPHFWSETDRVHYLEAMVRILRPYLQEEAE